MVKRYFGVKIESFKDEESFEYATFKNKILHRLKKYIEDNGELKIGYVLPMTSISNTQGSF